MAMVPVRGVAEKGILRDPSPYELDLNAWSNGSNVRFHASKAERAPIFRTVNNVLPEEPVFVAALNQSAGTYDSIMICSSDHRTWQWSAGTLTEVSPAQLNTPVITAGGTGYSSAPTVTFSAPSLPGGVRATGTATVSGGAVTGITVTNNPTGYATAPTISFGGPGTGATATVTLKWTPTTAPQAFTSTFMGEVMYINRPDMAPEYFNAATSTQFAPLPNMETTWTCRSLRAFGDYLIALNITKPATFTDPFTGLPQTGGTFPNLFKWSDLTLTGQVPGSWDPDDPTKSTGENPLEELDTPIVDGLPMRSLFVVYSENQIWGVQQNGSDEIFTFYKMFDEGGLIAPNCVVEVDGVHYVFGTTDIYKHDGISKASIIDKRNKDAVFRNLNKSKSEVCFSAYLPQYNSIVFGYNSADPNAAFSGTLCDRCNVGAVYDLTADTWSFIDLPNVSAITLGSLDTILTYANAPSTTTYANVGGSYYDQENTFSKSAVAVSATVSGLFTANRLVAYDFYDKGLLSFPYEPELNPPAFLERTGIALDQIGADLTTYKKIRRVFPLVTVFENVPITIQIGGAETPTGTPTYNTQVSFNPNTQYKVDGIKGGRYLAIRFTLTGPQDFEVAGYDLHITDGGRR